MAEWGSDGREEGVMGRVGIRRGGGRFDGELESGGEGGGVMVRWRNWD